jgi:hypothetical protein
VVSATAVAHELAAAGAAPSAAPDVEVGAARDLHLDPDLDPDLDAGSGGWGDDDGSASATAPRRRGRAATALGRAVHATLQVIDLADPAGPPDLDALVARQCDLEAVPELAPDAAALVRSALASDAVRLAVRHPHHRELSVVAPVGDRVVEGYVDLLVEGPDGLVVVDYKTDTSAGAAALDAKLAVYEHQGAAYALALERSLGVPVAEVRFVFCRPEAADERTVPDLRTAVDRVRRHLDPVGAG